MSKDPFGFAEASEDAGPAIDLDAFAPKPKPVDRQAAEAASAVAQDSGFSRRTARPRDQKPEPETPPPPASKGARRRISIAEAVGREDERYSDQQRAQLNVLAPLPIVMRWRELVRGADAPAWSILEQAMDALASQSTTPRRGEG
jgi:hypothetical protein